MTIMIEDLDEIPKLLIQMRKDAGWSKTKLADALNTRCDQITRWEKTHYSTISFKRLVQVFTLLESATQVKSR